MYKKLCKKANLVIKEFALGEKRCLYVYTYQGEEWDKICGIRPNWETLYERLYSRLKKDKLI